MKKRIALSTAALLITSAAHAAPVDLTGWIENGNPNNNSGTWNVQAGNDSVVQTINGQPTVFFDPGSNAQGTQLSGQITGGRANDDDFIGFVLGYQDGEINSTNADFWLVDWKQGDQAGQNAGLSLSHVSGDLTGTNTDVIGEWWQHNDPIFEVATGANLATTGWITDQTYDFDLIFTSSLIEISVDGETELSWSQADNGGVAFTDGAFGFYNFSQANVTYAGITDAVLPTDPAPVPLPAGLPLLLAGLGAFGWMRRRQQA